MPRLCRERQYPMMKKIYNEESGYKLKLFKLVDATVEYRAIIKLVEKIEL